MGHVSGKGRTAAAPDNSAYVNEAVGTRPTESHVSVGIAPTTSNASLADEERRKCSSVRRCIGRLPGTWRKVRLDPELLEDGAGVFPESRRRVLTS